MRVAPAPLMPVALRPKPLPSIPERAITDHVDEVGPFKEIFAGVKDVDAAARALGFKQPLPALVKEHQDMMRLHYLPDGRPMLMHAWGEFGHLENLSAGGVKLPTVTIKSDQLRVLILGDTGSGDADQKTVADALLRHSADDNHATHFALHVGDAFYGNGVRSPNEPRLKAHFEEMYGAFDRPLYLGLGNHEYGDSKGTGTSEALLAYAKANADTIMEMPARFYHFDYAYEGGKAEFFMLDTTMWASDDQQRAWLKEALSASTADHKIVIGHHPIGSGGLHGDSPHLDRSLLPLLQKHADLYVSGHEHNQQLLILKGGVPQLVSGTGCEEREVDHISRAKFSSSLLGFAQLNIDQRGLHVGFVGARTGKTLFETLLRSRQEAADQERAPRTEEKASVRRRPLQPRDPALV